MDGYETVIEGVSPLPVTPEEVREALEDARVVAAVQLALRDERVGRGYARLRSAGVSHARAVSALRGPWLDADGRAYYLSLSRVKSIITAWRRRGDGTSAEEG
ncbi:MAG: hypothetical protein R3181_00010 [Rubricoccaceae bacterium]|nr:hypothetical protein [Rubricoccaceae bacterium]